MISLAGTKALGFPSEASCLGCAWRKQQSDLLCVDGMDGSWDERQRRGAAICSRARMQGLHVWVASKRSWWPLTFPSSLCFRSRRFLPALTDSSTLHASPSLGWLERAILKSQRRRQGRVRGNWVSGRDGTAGMEKEAQGASWLNIELGEAGWAVASEALVYLVPRLNSIYSLSQIST